jgi:hypothetical protein
MILAFIEINDGGIGGGEGTNRRDPLAWHASLISLYQILMNFERHRIDRIKLNTTILTAIMLRNRFYIII